jgi:hypothetical protein
MKHLFTQLLPILYVRDLNSEVDFYVKLGFVKSYEEDSFITIKYNEFLIFGLMLGDFSTTDFKQQMIWQIGTNNLDEVYNLCKNNNIEIIEEFVTTEYKESIIKTLKVKSPNGYEVVFEEEIELLSEEAEASLAKAMDDVKNGRVIKVKNIDKWFKSLKNEK